MKIPANRVKEIINEWWHVNDSQEKYDASSERGPNISNMLQTQYQTNDLSHLDFTHFNFSGCSLHYLNFANTIFDGSNFEGADLFSSDFSYAKLNQCINLNKAGLANAKLCFVDFSECDLSKIQLESVDVSGAIFSRVNFTHATFIDIDFSNADIKGADFSFSKFDQISFESILPALLKNEVKFDNLLIKDIFNLIKPAEKSELLEKILPLVKKHKITLAGMDLSHADLSDLDLSNISFANVNLSRAILSNTNLMNANFSRAKLHNANLQRATLNRINWSNADISGAIFTQSIGVTSAQISAACHVDKCTGLPGKIVDELEKRHPRNVRKIDSFFTTSPKRKQEVNEDTTLVCLKKRIV